MAERVREVFFSLLKSALWGGKLDIEVGDVSRKELGRVVMMAKSQTVLGLIAHEIMRRDEFANIFGPEHRERLTFMIQENYFLYQRLNVVLLSIVSELRKHGIEPVLLKGQGISKYYPIPELRQCGDIDVYVGQENFQKSCEVIGAMSTPEDHQGDIPSLKHFHTRIGSAFIEIHRYTDVYFPHRYDLKYQKISDAGMSSDLVPLDFGDTEIMTPSIDFNVFFIFNHFWHHFIADGVGLRQLCDWVRLLHVNYGKINLDYLSKVLCEMKLMKEWKIFGYIAVNTLGLPIEEMPFYDQKYRKTAEKVLELIMLEGNFGKENMKGYNRPKGYVAGKLYSFIKRTERNFRVLRLFPFEAIRHIVRIFVGGLAVMFNDKFAKYAD